MERLDLYDINKINTHKTILRGEEVPHGFYRYVVHICIFNSKGEMLIQKRAACKKFFPSRWDISVGGCVSSGENSQEAMMREIKEEIGVDIDLKNVRPAFTFSFDEGYDDFYVIVKDIDLEKCKLQKEEVEEIKYANLDEINEMMKKKDFIIYQPYFIDFIFHIKDSTDIFIESMK